MGGAMGAAVGEEVGEEVVEVDRGDAAGAAWQARHQQQQPL
jgi:hypothetical protein